jgi:hypothetical protein
MQTIKQQTESFLFETGSGQFRGMPFYELSIDEWVVYQKKQPKYLLDFNRRHKPLIKDLTAKLNSGEGLEEIVSKLGRFLGREWTTRHNIEGTIVPNSQNSETVELLVLDDLADLFMDLTIVAADTIELDILLNEARLFDTYGIEDKDGFWGLESAWIDNFDNLNNLLTFLFHTKVSLTEIASNEDKKIFDLTQYKQGRISPDELEVNYQDWIKISGRENTMDEYGNLISIIGYVNRNIDKNKLILISEKRKHFS